MNHILLFSFIFIIFIIISQLPMREGFNSYFRQTVRPHVRTIKGIQNTTGEKFSMQIADIGRIFGII